MPTTSLIPRKLRVLVVEDSSVVSHIIKLHLSGAKNTEFSLDFTDRLTKAFSRLSKKSYDIVLLDLGLPDSMGLQTFVRLKVIAPDVPTVVVTGLDNEEIALEALRLGAQDYIVKSHLNESLLVKSIYYAIERKRAAERLRLSEERHRTMLQALPDFVCQADRNFTIGFVNNSVKDLGFSPEDLIGQSMSKIMFEEDFVRLYSLFQNILQNKEEECDPSSPNSWLPGDQGSLDVLYLTREGEKVPVSLSYSTIRDEKGSATGLVSIARDMRAMKKLIDDLSFSRDELRKKTSQLIQTEKMTALGELAAGVAHELNQPLNAIKMTCEDLRRDLSRKRLEPGSLEESLLDVTIEVTKMAEIIDHMRIFTRGTVERVVEPFNADRPVQGALKFLQRELAQFGINLRTEIDKTTLVKGDPVKLEQVILNLLVNARDAVLEVANQREMEIEIKTYVEKTDDQALSVMIYEIRDNGPGIPDSIRMKIFEPFFTRKEPGKGTGLGLSIVKEIIDEFQGIIELDSQEDEGTTFRIMIPVNETQRDTVC